MQFNLSPYNLDALPRSTIVAISSARCRLISPSRIIPVSAIARACLAVFVPIQAASSQPASGPPPKASVPKRTFSGNWVTRDRNTGASVAGELINVVREKSR